MRDRERIREREHDQKSSSITTPSPWELHEDLKGLDRFKQYGSNFNKLGGTFTSILLTPIQSFQICEQLRSMS